jgi:hypothetical protein
VQADRARKVSASTLKLDGARERKDFGAIRENQGPVTVESPWLTEEQEACGRPGAAEIKDLDVRIFFAAVKILNASCPLFGRKTINLRKNRGFSLVFALFGVWALFSFWAR